MKRVVMRGEYTREHAERRSKGESAGSIFRNVMKHHGYPIIGMSPGNSYFKDVEIRHLLRETVERFGRTCIFVADIPAIATYRAFGYPENRARTKAVPKGNNLKNRTRRLMQELGYDAIQVRIIEWATEVADHPAYRQIYEMRVKRLYDSCVEFSREGRQIFSTLPYEVIFVGHTHRPSRASVVGYSRT